jgi:hypothetical protein
VTQPNRKITKQWDDYFVAFQGNAASSAGPYIVTSADATLTNAFDLGGIASGYVKSTVVAGQSTPSTVSFIPQSDLRWTPITKAFVDSGFVASAGQMVLTNATGGVTVIKLPAAPADGQSVIVKKIDASGNAVTVDGNGVNVDGAATHALALQWNSAICVFSSTGAAWFIAGQV